jgi:hypothetical protein
MIVDLDSGGTGTFYTIRSASSGAHPRAIVWSDVGGGVINLHTSLGAGQRSAVPFQSFKKNGDDLEEVDLESRAATGRLFRRVAMVTGLPEAK